VDAGLEIVPVVNKIDLPSADPVRVAQEIEDVIGLDAADVLPVSAKEGKGIAELLEALVARVPPPKGDPAAPTRALVFDSWFDPYVGAVMLVRVVDGVLRRGGEVRMMAAGHLHQITGLHVIDPHPRAVDELGAGEVGMVVAGVKTLADVKIGDTLTDARVPASQALPGFREVKPMVFTGLYPVDPDDYEDLKTALEKLRLNDASLSYEPETSAALGFGFRCGFLGFLHAEIIQERLEREHALDLITTAPTVRYRVVMLSGEVREIESPAEVPSPADVDRIEAAMEPALAEEIYELERCIECGCCVAGCGTARMRENFVGAVGLNKIARFRLDPRDRRTDDDYYELIGDDDGVFGCMSLLACHDVCPKDLPLATQIAFLRRKMVSVGWK